MELQGLYTLLGTVSTLVRTGEVETHEQVGPLHVATLDLMPSEAEVVDGLEIVDMVLVKVGVDKARAEEHRQEFISICDQLPVEIMRGGPSYIHLGAELGDQGIAFQFMAVGQVLGLWKVITPMMFGLTGDDAKQTAGMGMVMISGYRKGEQK